MKLTVLFGVATALTAGMAACGDAQERRAEAQVASVALERAPAPAPRPALSAEDERMYREAAEAAWRYMEANYQSATGLVNATPDWTYTTVWDVGGQMLAFLSARDLGLLAPAEYEERTRRVLATLERAPLFRGAAFNKVYSTKNASMGDGTRGATGWSATDLGRLLVALRVTAEREPQHREQIERIVKRLDYGQIVKDGYVHGQLIGSRGQPWTFQEGRIGYEQYVARGFQLWGQKVDNALNPKVNAEPVEVLGVPLLRDRRGLDRLVSDPFIMLGVELGLTGDMRDLAQAVLNVQEARFRQTGQITMVTEDAVAVPPHYFYYYCVYCNGKPFVVDLSTPGKDLDGPRWVSTKATFGWHALMPSDYTRQAMEHIRPALDARQGWASGVYEKTGKSTETYDINTASLVLEVAAFQLRGGRPLIEPGGTASSQ